MDTFNSSESMSVSNSQLVNFKEILNDNIDRYTRKRNKNKAGAYVVQTFIILFSFGTTVLIGWKVSDDSAYKELIINFALVLSALVTGLSTLDKFFDYKAFWIDYNVAIAGLKHILRKVEYLESFGPENITRKQLDELFNLFELVCSTMDKNYKEIRSARDE